jgi:predicted RNase H-like nuclease (RuvC/YqgF family)
MMSDNARAQSPNATGDAAKTKAEVENMIRLVYETLSGLRSIDQSLTRNITELNQQCESLQVQIGMELIKVNEPTIHHIRIQLQNLDEERSKQHTERTILRQDLHRRCLAFLGETGGINRS